jgi:micrococcal nuclease
MRAQLAVLAVSASTTLGLALPARLAGQSDLRQEIAAQVARYVEAINSGDARRVADLYARSSGVTSAGDGEITRGWSEVLSLLGDFLDALGSVTMTADSLAVTSVGSGGAVAVFKYRWIAARERDTTTYEGAMTLVYERTPLGWRIVHDHTSSLRSQPSRRAGRAYPLGPTGPAELCIVERIVDGDTLICAPGVRVRLIGIDTPELSQRPHGDRARRALEALIPVGSAVQLERDVEPADRYGRRLAYVWREGRLVNWEMLRDGWALLFTYPPNVRYVEAFQEAHRLAREERRGLWAVDAFSCPPVDRRRRVCN